jgi:hypothetical protein
MRPVVMQTKSIAMLMKSMVSAHMLLYSNSSTVAMKFWLNVQKSRLMKGAVD